MADWVREEQEWVQYTKAHNASAASVRGSSQVTTKPMQDSKPTEFHQYAIAMLGELLDLNNSNAVPAEAAQNLATRFCRETDPETAWNDFLNSFISATMHSAQSEPIQKLLQFLLELARQPDAHNASGGVVMVDKISSSPREVSPGGALSSVGGPVFFSDLPWFNMSVREVWNGPRTLVRRYGSLEMARRKWENINTFLAHLSSATEAKPTVLRDWPREFGLQTICDGLEDDADEAVGNYMRSAVRWLLIDRDGLYRRVVPLTGGENNNEVGRQDPCGPLWKAQIVDGQPQSGRWNFWRSRLQEMAAIEPGPEGAETTKLVVQAIDHMAQGQVLSN